MTKTSEIKALRKRMGLTVAGFALAVGCTRKTIRNWERGLAVQPRYRERLDAVAADIEAGVCSVVVTEQSPVTLTGVREYCEEYPVTLRVNSGRLVIVATNEGGHNSTEVDLRDLLNWLAKNKPEVKP